MKKALKYSLLTAGIFISALAVALLVIYISAPMPLDPTRTGEDADGHGTVSVENTLSSGAKRRNSLVIKFRTGRGGIKEKGGIKINLGHDIVSGDCRMIYAPFEPGMPRQCTCSTCLLGNVIVKSDNPCVELEADLSSDFNLFRKYMGILKYIRTHKSADFHGLMRSLHAGRTLNVRVIKGSLVRGDLVTVEPGNTERGSDASAVILPVNMDIIVRTDGNANGTYKLIQGSAILEKTASETARFNLVTQFNPDPGVPVELIVSAVDKFPARHSTSHYTGSVHLSSNNRVTGLPEKISFREKDNGVKRLRIIFPERGLYRIFVCDRNGISGASHFIDTRKHDKKIFFGDMHVHTVFSMDGNLKPEYVYKRNRNVYGHDFCCITDSRFRKNNGCMKHDGAEKVMHTRQWKYAHTLAERYNEPGRFITLTGYELSGPSGSERIISVCPETLKNNPLQPGLKGHDAIVVSDPGFLVRSETSGRIAPENAGSGLVEIYNRNGSFEYDGCRTEANPICSKAGFINGLTGLITGHVLWCGHANPECPVRYALAQGHRFGFTGSGYSDNFRIQDTAFQPGITAVYSEGLHRKNICESLVNSEIYATTGARIGLRFTCDGNPMGSTVAVERCPEIVAEILGHGPIKMVELVRYDGTDYKNIFQLRVDTFSGASPSVTKNTSSSYFADSEKNIVRFFYRDESFACDSFYYLRVTQEDGNMAWSSPVWVSRKCSSGL